MDSVRERTQPLPYYAVDRLRLFEKAYELEMFGSLATLCSSFACGATHRYIHLYVRDAGEWACETRLHFRPCLTENETPADEIGCPTVDMLHAILALLCRHAFGYPSPSLLHGRSLSSTFAKTRRKHVFRPTSSASRPPSYRA